MSREATTFHDFVAQLGFASGKVDDADKPAFRALMTKTVDILQDTIASIDFWPNPDKQKRVRSLLKTEIARSDIEELKQNRERVAIEIMRLARNRHDELTRAGREDG
jgi:type I restriction enzyme R subunit